MRTFTIESDGSSISPALDDFMLLDRNTLLNLQEGRFSYKLFILDENGFVKSFSQGKLTVEDDALEEEE